MRALRRVSADARVARAGEKHELPIGRAKHALYRGRQPRGKVRMFLEKEQQPVRIHGHADEQDHGDDELLAPRHRHQPRPRGDEVGAIFLREGDGGGDGAGRVLGVGVGEKKKVAGGLLRELVAGPVFPRPAGRERGTGEQVLRGGL